MTSLLARTRIVLVAPTLPENVGAVARAMGCFGASELVVAGVLEPASDRARTLAAGHDGLLEQARRVPDLAAALDGVVLAIGTTARPQGAVDRLAITPTEAASLAADHAEAGPVALVFGPESRGLTNDELRRCHQLVTIDGEPGTCLNLAQAAAVLLHAWRGATPGPLQAPGRLAAEAGLGDLAERLLGLLAERGLVREAERASKRHTLRRVLSRTSLTADEAAMVAGWLAAWRRVDAARD